MKPAVVITCIGMTISFALAQDNIGWRGIVPLRSTRAQVEQKLGALDVRCQCYLTETEIVRVKYSRGHCKGDLAGWNVPTDTVLSFEITPKKPLLFSKIQLKEQEFVRTVDDTVTTYYGNGEKGVRYSVSSLGTVASIWYGPSVKDNHLRCAGFPFTDGGVTAYTPYYEFFFETLEDMKGHLGEFGVRLIKEPQFKGYVIVYGGKDKKIDIGKFSKSAKDYLIEELNIDPDSLDAINGGYREKATVELFLIPRDWPPPVATPTFSGVNCCV